MDFYWCSVIEIFEYPVFITIRHKDFEELFSAFINPFLAAILTLSSDN